MLHDLNMVVNFINARQAWLLPKKHLHFQDASLTENCKINTYF